MMRNYKKRIWGDSLPINLFHHKIQWIILFYSKTNLCFFKYHKYSFINWLSELMKHETIIFHDNSVLPDFEGMTSIEIRTKKTNVAF